MSELDHMDGLAAEYVLGTLDVEEREQARTLLDTDVAFAAKVESWERRFGDLYLMVEPVEPDSAIWPRIKAKMLDVRERTRATEPPMPVPAPASTAAEPPSLDAIEAVISETATTLNSEATPGRKVPGGTQLALPLDRLPHGARRGTRGGASGANPGGVADDRRGSDPRARIGSDARASVRNASFRSDSCASVGRNFSAGAGAAARAHFERGRDVGR